VKPSSSYVLNMVNTPGKIAVSFGLSILIAKLMLHDKWGTPAEE
jgi:hypothetical protein